MGDTGVDEGDFSVENPRLRNPNGFPQPDGILCPWNRTDKGPAKQRIHCLVYHGWDDWLNQSDASGEPPFCKNICHHGKMDANQRSRAMKAHRAWLNLKANLNRRMRWLDTIKLKDRLGRRI